MIDYNVSPSFILSREASWNLADSFSSSLYSTEYDLYKELIRSIYAQVNGVLSRVRGYEWTGREVPGNGIVINTYQRESEIRRIVINYTSDSILVDGAAVPALSAAVID